MALRVWEIDAEFDDFYGEDISHLSGWLDCGFFFLLLWSGRGSLSWFSVVTLLICSDSIVSAFCQLQQLLLRAYWIFAEFCGCVLDLCRFGGCPSGTLASIRWVFAGDWTGRWFFLWVQKENVLALCLGEFRLELFLWTPSGVLWLHYWTGLAGGWTGRWLPLLVLQVVWTSHGLLESGFSSPALDQFEFSLVGGGCYH